MNLLSINLFIKLSNLLFLSRIYFSIKDLLSAFKSNKPIIFISIYTFSIIIIGLLRFFLVDDIYNNKIYLIIAISYFCESALYIFEKITGICGTKRLVFNVFTTIFIFGFLIFIYPYFLQTQQNKKKEELNK